MPKLIFHLNKGDHGNGTPAASSASERFILYAIADWTFESKINFIYNYEFYVSHEPNEIHLLLLILMMKSAHRWRHSCTR